MRATFTIAFIVGLAPALALGLTPEEIVQKMDETMTFNTRVGEASLTVERAGAAPDTRSLKIWGRGWDDSYSVFQSPARDKGIKYLKLQKSLYMYLPRTEKVVTISGHLLRQSIMDSDFSYEDMLESRALLADYDVKLVGDDTFAGDKCWVLDLTAKREGVSYYRRKIWVSQKTFVPLKVERYAESGLLLKVLTYEKIVAFGARNFPTRMVMQDQLRKGSRSVFQLDNLQFDVAVPDALFSRRNLMKQD